MQKLEYVGFESLSPEDFIPLLNKQKIREHLINHELFDLASVRAWIDSKITVNAEPGCRVRAVLVDGHLAGWCAIQREGEKYELAIVIDEHYWGLGVKIFQELMQWAKVFGHQTVLIHFLDTRPEYKFLRKIANHVYKSELLGHQFTTYELALDKY